jgi:HEAT repeat protein
MANLAFAFVLLFCVTTVLAQNRAGAREGAEGPMIASLDDAMKALKSPDAAQQIAGAQWMAANKPDAAAVVPALVPLLDTPGLQRELSMHVVRTTPATTAYRAISSLMPAAIDPLIAAFDHPSAHVRANILRLLVARLEERVMKLMIAAMKDSSAEVRTAAARGLLSYNSISAVEALQPALSDNDPAVRSAAAWSLGYAAAQTSPGMPISNERQSEVVKELEARLTDPVKEVKLVAAEALGRLHNQNAVESLMKAAEDKEIQPQVVQALGEIGSHRAVPVLLPLLNSSEWVVKSLTCQALVKIPDVRAVTPLLPLLKDADPAVAMNAATALGAIGDRRATGPLIEMLAAPNHHTRAIAAQALGKIRDPKAVQPLIAQLATGDEPGREAALALGDLADPAAIDPLVAMIFAKQEDQYTIDAACDALEQIHSPRVIRTLAEKTLATRKQGYATHRARRTLDKLLNTDFAFSQDALRDWWAKHKGEFEGE